MNNLQKITVAATLTVLGSLNLATKAQAQETYNQPFSGNVPGTCVFNDVSGENVETLTYDTVNYSFNAAVDTSVDFSVLCPVNATITVGVPQQTGGPAITASLDSPFGVLLDGVGTVIADSSGFNGLLTANDLIEFDVEMTLDYGAPLVPGDYSFIVPITFTPQ